MNQVARTKLGLDSGFPLNKARNTAGLEIRSNPCIRKSARVYSDVVRAKLLEETFICPLLNRLTSSVIPFTSSTKSFNPPLR